MIIIVPIILGVSTGYLWYSFAINERGKYGQGDTVDKVQAVIVGICGFLFWGSLIFGK